MGPGAAVNRIKSGHPTWPARVFSASYLRRPGKPVSENLQFFYRLLTSETLALDRVHSFNKSHFDFREKSFRDHGTCRCDNGQLGT